MSYPCNRLRDDYIKLQIQIELNNQIIFDCIDFFQSIQNEYQRKWRLVELNVSRDTYDIVKTRGYQNFYKFITSKKLFTYNELEWVEDAIHEVLTC
jgi:hypothetical protein